MIRDAPLDRGDPGEATVHACMHGPLPSTLCLEHVELLRQEREVFGHLTSGD
jgi:hypothetical protein